MGTIDRQQRFSLDQAITATAVSTDHMNLRAVRDLFVGSMLWLINLVTVAFTDAGSDSTVAVTMESDDATAFPSATVVQSFGTFAALAAIGARLQVPVAPFLVDEQFIRLRYTVANGNLTTGSITSWLTDSPDLYTQYPDNKIIG